MTGLFNYAELHQLARLRGSYYQEAEPFPHIVLDGIVSYHFLRTAQNAFPDSTQIKWYQYDNPLEKKLAKNHDLPETLRNILLEFNSMEFIQFLEVLTGIEGLIPDPKFNGGGLHRIERGGKLDIHADYNFHPVTQLDRRLNVILYLNENWQEWYGGHLELWDNHMTKCVQRILPIFNRMVIFNTTDASNHGHPEPLNCPENIARKSMALYYYTNGRPYAEQSEPHSTLFRKRPQDADSAEIDALRAQRAKGRVKDLIKE